MKKIIEWLWKYAVENVFGALIFLILGYFAVYRESMIKYVWYDGHGFAIITAAILSTCIILILMKYDLLGINRFAEQKAAAKLTKENQYENQLLYITKFIRMINNDIEILRAFNNNPTGYATGYIENRIASVGIIFDSHEYHQYREHVDRCLIGHETIKKYFPDYKRMALAKIEELELRQRKLIDTKNY